MSSTPEVDQSPKDSEKNQGPEDPGVQVRRAFLPLYAEDERDKSAENALVSKLEGDLDLTTGQVNAFRSHIIIMAKEAAKEHCNPDNIIAPEKLISLAHGLLQSSPETWLNTSHELKAVAEELDIPEEKVADMVSAYEDKLFTSKKQTKKKRAQTKKKSAAKGKPGRKRRRESLNLDDLKKAPKDKQILTLMADFVDQNEAGLTQGENPNQDLVKSLYLFSKLYTECFTTEVGNPSATTNPIMKIYFSLAKRSNPKDLGDMIKKAIDYVKVSTSGSK